jgi:dTDP-4-amino-4,6-dideoxygalactose transaminase
MIPVFSNTLGQSELAAVDRVFASRWLGKGKECAAFEAEFAQHLGQERVLLFNSCTSATFVLLQAMGIGPGDEVIIPTVQFVGVANAVMACGARPVFADVDRFTLNLLPSEVTRLYNAKTAAVFLLHYGGHPAPFVEIQEAAGVSLPILEDAANAVASTYYGRACGTLGHAGVWSFDAMKELVMVDGGALWMLYDKRLDLAESLRYFGMPTKRSSGTDSAASGADRWWEFEVNAPAGRHISNDVLASVARMQLQRLPGFILRRKRLWQRYQCAFADVPGLALPPEPLAECTSSYYFYWVQLEKRDELAHHLVDHDVYCTFRYYPLHLIPFYGHEGHLPNAEWAAEHTLNLPIHQNLTDGQQSHIIRLVKEFMDG